MSEKSNIDAIYAEFPGLHQVLPKKQVSEAMVARIDLSLMSTNPARNVHVFYFLDEKGEVGYTLKDENYDPSIFGTLILSIFRRYVPLITLRQCLMQLGSNADRVRHIIEVRYGHILTVYKPPKGYLTMGAWLKHEEAETRKVLQEP